MPKKTKRVPVPGSERSAPRGADRVGDVRPDERVRVSVILRPRRSLRGLQSSSAFKAVPPRDRQYLSREELARDYGADPRDVRKIEAFAHEHNLTVMEVSLPRRAIVLSGSVAQLSAAFEAQLSAYSREGETFRGRTGPLTVPAELDGIVRGVFGLDNRRQARPRCRIRRPSQAANPADDTVYTANQLASLYKFPAGSNGTGQCIGIIEFGGGYQTSDLAAYFSQLGIPQPSVTAVSVDGVQNSPSPGSDSPDTEVDLDIEVAGTVAPGASIVVYFSDFTEQGWVDAITTAVHDTLHNPSVISVSWGYPEGQDVWTQQAMQAVSDAFQTATAAGITLCLAAGDDGSRDEVSDGLAHVDFPASSPYTLACGGTTLVSSNGTITSEVVWNDGEQGGATGGGVSDVFPLPSWQTSAGVPPSANPGGHIGRGVPDVAADSDPNTGIQILSDGQQEVVGGTSAATPLWAGLIACVNQELGKPVGFLNPLIYPLSESHGAFNDIVSGNNEIVSGVPGYSAGPGWDACTGWGSPNGAGLLAALQGGSSIAGQAKKKAAARQKNKPKSSARAKKRPRG